MFERTKNKIKIHPFKRKYLACKLRYSFNKINMQVTSITT